MKLKLSLLLFIIYISMWAQQRIHQFPVSGSLYVPAGITSINARVWGGGGAGGAANTPDIATGRGGAGGGAGAYVTGTITVAPGTTINTVVALQTAGSTGNGANGGFSTITNFTNVIYAAGGTGGAANTTGNTPAGGAGGTVAGSFGTTRTAGGNGNNGATSALALLFSSGAGGNAPNSAGGGGTGGAGIVSAIGGVNGPGNPGNPFGGGGSGGIHTNPSSSTIYNGGAGARGHIILDYTCNTYSITGTAAANTCITAGTTTVTLTSSAANLPVGTYTVTYSRSNPSATLQTATMTVSTAGTGTFTATGFTNVGTSTVTITNLASGDCTYTVTTGNVSNAFTISPASVGGSVTPDRTICSGFTSGVLTLAGHTGTVLRWESSVNPFSTWTPIANTTTTYTSGALTQTTRFRAVVQSGTCVSENSSFATVTVNPLPAITLGTVVPVCTSPNAQNTTLAYSGAVNSPTNYSIVWNTSPTNTFAAVNDATLSGGSISIVVPAATAPGTYTGTVTVRNANCTSSPVLPFSVVVNPLPTITLGAVAPICTSGNAQNTTLAYTATTNSPTTYSITWNASPANNFAAVTNVALPATPISIAVPGETAAGTYTGTLTVRNANSCTASPGVPFSVVVNPLPTISLGTVAPVCASANLQNTTLTYLGTTNSPTNYSITWNSSPANNFAAVTNAALPASPISITVPAGTAAGTYTGTITVSNANSCVSMAGVPFSVIVNPLPTITLGPVAAVCASASAQNTTIAYSGTTNSATTYSITWSPSPTNNFVPITNNALPSSPIIISVPAGTLAGTYNGTLTVTNPNSCTSNPGVNFNVVVYPLPPSPVIGTVTPATCLVATGSVALSGLPSGGVLTRYPGAIVESYTGNTATISGLSPNTYSFTVSNATCTSLSTNVIIPGVITNTYTTSWSNGTPTEDQNIVFAGNFVSAGGGAGDIRACSCTVNSGVSITIQSLDTLTLTNSLSNNGGSLTFENNSSLIQITNAVNTGDITYKRITTPIVRGDFVYWSTPVNPQRLIDVSPLTLNDKYMGYNGTNWVITSPTSNMMVGKGYIIRAPQTYSLTDKALYQASFTGQPNNGDLFGETVAAGKFYLIGNPYPSALDANLFLVANSFLNGTLYFWTHNTSVDLVGAYRYTSADYASYNLTGGVATGKAAPTGTPDNNNSIPTGKIAAGQSFFATTNNSGTVAFINEMRSGGVDNSQFFKTENTDNAAIVEKHRVWLNMTNSEGAFKQTLIGYVEGATNNFENKYDGVTFDGNPYLDFYSIGSDNRYVIQGRALPFKDNDIVPLGYRSTINGDFTISIDHADGNLTNHAIYLEDKVTKTIHNLQTGHYTFSTSTGTFTDRFVLTYANKTLGTGEFDMNDKNVIVAVQNKVITITSNAEKIDTVYIYDFSGKLIYKSTNVSDTSLKIDNLKISDQVLLVKVILDTNATKTYKIVF